jgi:hypothetical protein
LPELPPGSAEPALSPHETVVAPTLASRSSAESDDFNLTMHPWWRSDSILTKKSAETSGARGT